MFYAAIPNMSCDKKDVSSKLNEILVAVSKMHFLSGDHYFQHSEFSLFLSGYNVAQAILLSLMYC